MGLNIDDYRQLAMHSDGKAIIFIDLEERALIDEREMVISVNRSDIDRDGTRSDDIKPVGSTSVVGYIHKTVGNGVWLSYIRPENFDTVIEPVLEVRSDAIRSYRLQNVPRPTIKNS